MIKKLADKQDHFVRFMQFSISASNILIKTYGNINSTKLRFSFILSSVSAVTVEVLFFPGYRRYQLDEGSTFPDQSSQHLSHQNKIGVRRHFKDDED